MSSFPTSFLINAEDAEDRSPPKNRRMNQTRISDNAGVFPAVLRLFCAVVAVVSIIGCATTNTPNASGIASVNINPGVAGPVQGVGIEGQDIVSMSDEMMRDMLGDARLTRPTEGKSPRVIIDATLFLNDSTQPINRNIITDRLRVSLNRAAKGRLQFVGRNYSAAVERERSLKRAGVTDVGTTGMTKAVLGADYRLGGRITSIDSKSARTGMIQRMTQITFEMFDLETQEIVWSGIYTFARAAGDDVVYR